MAASGTIAQITAAGKRLPCERIRCLPLMLDITGSLLIPAFYRFLASMSKLSEGYGAGRLQHERRFWWLFYTSAKTVQFIRFA
jgi:hypothetical protein